jgi:molecular chaperone HscB
MRNYFELLSIEKRYDIDLGFLNKQYLAMQVQYHPDITSGKSHDISIASDLSRAYSILKDDFKRAEYMLLLAGVSLDDSQAYIVLSDLELEHIWNDREILEYTEDKSDLEKMMQNKLAEKNTLITKLTEAFVNEDFKAALYQTVLLKYINNFLENIERKIRL